MEEEDTSLWAELEELKGQRPHETHKSCFVEKVGWVAAETLGSAQERGPELAQRRVCVGRYPVERSEKDVHTFEMANREVDRY